MLTRSGGKDWTARNAERDGQLFDAVPVVYVDLG